MAPNHGRRGAKSNYFSDIFGTSCRIHFSSLSFVIRRLLRFVVLRVQPAIFPMKKTRAVKRFHIIAQIVGKVNVNITPPLRKRRVKSNRLDLF